MDNAPHSSPFNFQRYAGLAVWLLYAAVTYALSGASGLPFTALALVYPLLVVLSGLLARQAGIGVMTLLALGALGLFGRRQTADLLGLAALLLPVLLTGLAVYAYQRAQSSGQAGQAGPDAAASETLRAGLEDQVRQHVRSAEDARLQAEMFRSEMEAAQHDLETQVWLASAQVRLSESLGGEQTIEALAEQALRQVCAMLEAPIGVLFFYHPERQLLEPAAGYSLSLAEAPSFELGQGLVGQAAAAQRAIFVRGLTDEGLIVRSAFGSSPARELLVYPLTSADELVGVLEMGWAGAAHPLREELLERISGGIAVALETAYARQQVNQLLAATRQQAVELQAQEEELRAANEELQAQTERLRAAAQRLNRK